MALLVQICFVCTEWQEGLAAVIFGSIEMVNGDYNFTVSLIKLAEALIQNCLSLDQDYPEKSKSVIMLRFVGHLVDLFETFYTAAITNSVKIRNWCFVIRYIFYNLG